MKFQSACIAEILTNVTEGVFFLCSPGRFSVMILFLLVNLFIFISVTVNYVNTFSVAIEVTVS